MRKPIWSWTNTLTRLGFTPRKNGTYGNHAKSRRLQFEPLEQRQLLATDLALGAFHANGYDLLVDYEVTGDDARPFDIEIYTSRDGVTADKLLTTQEIVKLDQRQVGGHTASIRPEFTDLPEDYFLLAVLDARSKVTEENELNNQLLFAGGTFKTTDGAVQIHGTPQKDTLKVRDWGTHLDVELNGALSVHVSSYAAVYVRTHGSDDALIVHSPSEPAASIWAVDQYGADLLIEAGVGDERVVTRGVGGTTPVDGAAGGNQIQPLGGRDGGPAPGDLDVTFDEGLEPAGVVLTDFIGLTDRAYDVAMQPYGNAGKIVVSGKTYYMGYKLGLTCYNADGSLDDNGPNDSTPGDWFGVGGKVTTPLRYSDAVPLGMVVQADGKIVASGLYGSTNALIRYNANGSLDASFGSGGIALLGISPRDLAIDA